MQPEYPQVGVGAVLLNEHNEVLLQLRKRPPEAGCWSLPGGRVEFGELLEDAILRELNEELGIVAAVEKLLCVTDHIIPADNAHWVSPTYLVRVLSGDARNREPEKTEAIQWFPLSELPGNLSIVAKNALAAFGLS